MFRPEIQDERGGTAKLHAPSFFLPVIGVSARITTAALNQAVRMSTRREFIKRGVLAGATASLPNWHDLSYHFLTGSGAVSGDVEGGLIELNEKQLDAGSTINLTGNWLFKPSYAVGAGDSPDSVGHEGYTEVPVPQLLSRVRWWLDDSDDFDRWENERLGRLGFDTERADEGWYRLYIDMPELPSDRHVFIEFDGVAMISKAFLNGMALGGNAGMFGRFGYDLTRHLRAGRNVFALFVSMEKIPAAEISLGEAVTVNLTASKVLTMSKGMYGPLSPNNDNRAYDLYGIWQPVRLMVRDRAMIEDAWFIPSLDAAEVRVEARALGRAATGILEVSWTDHATGEHLAGARPHRVRLGEDTRTEIIEVSGISPRHWTPADPHLYRMDVALKAEDGTLLDYVSHNVGFRTFEVRGNRLFLNGKPYWLRGANHLPYGKNPWDPELPKTLIGLMHEGNQRVTRTHCTPWNETWLQAADEIGLGVSIEGIRPWALVGHIGPPPPHIYEHWLVEHEDVVRRCRNHPSVLMWTVGNEMMLRDHHNVAKWKLLSGVVERTRRLDPTRPVICSSDYMRDPEFYQEELEPHGVDDGDIDDIHRYNGWYSPSNFVQDSFFEKELEKNRRLRPMIGQEMSTGYPDLDNGLPVLRYTRDLIVPQAWVGRHALPGRDPSVWLKEHAAVTKRWAEQLRFQRSGRTAGFMLFANECWYRHSFEADSVRPYPVHEAIRHAWAPIGLALKTPRRRFYGGRVLETSIFVTNDDEQFRVHQDLTLVVDLETATGEVLSSQQVGRLTRIAYYDVIEVPVSIAIPAVDGAREHVSMVIRLMAGTDEISRTVDPVEIFGPSAAPDADKSAADKPVALALNLGPELGNFVERSGLFRRVLRDPPSALDEDSTLDPASAFEQANVILLGGPSHVDLLAQGHPVRNWVQRGGTAVAFSAGADMERLFPDHIDLVQETIGEYADPWPTAGTPLGEDLEPMDLKWWGRRGEDAAYVAATHHRLTLGSEARTLVRFVPSHGYVREEVVPGLLRSVLSEIPLGKGRLWVCDLDFEASVGVDPAADLFARNLFAGAGDPRSTERLAAPPAYERLLEQRRSEED